MKTILVIVLILEKCRILNSFLPTYVTEKKNPPTPPFFMAIKHMIEQSMTCREEDFSTVVIRLKAILINISGMCRDTTSRVHCTGGEAEGQICATATR